MLARFPADAEGEAELAAVVRDAYEPRPWRLWEEDPRAHIGARVRAAREQGSFDRWQRQMRPAGPRPGWSVQAVFDWAQEGLERGAVLHVPAARCLSAVAGPEDRAEIVQAARSGSDGARGTALRYLADARDPAVLDLIEYAVEGHSRVVADAATEAFERMGGPAPVERARRWAYRPDALGAAAGRVLASRGDAQDSKLVLSALREAVRGEGPDAPTLWTLVDGADASASPAPPPCCATSTARPPPPTCAAAPPGRSPPPTPPSPRASPSNASGTARNPPGGSPRGGAETGDARVVNRLRRLAADPAEEDEVQTAVRSRIGPDADAPAV